MILLILLPVVLISRSLAQDYSIPLQWVNTTSSLSRNDRIKLSSDVLETLDPLYSSINGTIPALQFFENADLFIATTIYDSLAASESNRVASRGRFSFITGQLAPETLAFGVDLVWGIAAIEAFKAYNDTYFLDNAVAIWQTYSPSVITQSDADLGRYGRNDATFPSTCNGYSNAGGVLLISNITNPSLIIGTTGTGNYMGLSAHLFNLTNQQMYHDAAQLSMTFIRSHLLNYTDNGTIVLHPYFELIPCQPIGGDVSSLNSGVYLEALSTFAYATNNDTLMQEYGSNFLIHLDDSNDDSDRANQFALNAMKFSPWNSENGVVREDPSNLNAGAPLRGALMRGLYRHWTHSPKDSEIAKVIKAFLLVQYNNLQNNVQFNTSRYSPDWKGPPMPSLIPRGQLNALDVLNFAIGVEGDPPLMVTTHSLSLGHIIGGAVGGFVLVAIAALALAICYRRKTQSRRNNLHYGNSETIMMNEIVPVPRNQGPFIEPFPPPFPTLDLPNSSKLRNEFQHVSATPAAVAHDSPPSPSPQPPSPPTAPQEHERRVYSDLSLSIPSSAPPEYQTVVG
ncbi:hypothetical protein QCA50_008166 [Cerrena zonata]|uniref:Epidermal growth factor receptor-like transmembrane-juxtamembrane segment domain-containing protein n=1 Tax=Cerrena zonata TaxID=2478898 RepID=A0AAW0G4M3_9APHY